jgi:nucleotidyltransferase/DNA polymerase involved in DNA repair
VVAAASYEARKFGVRSAMPSVTAKRRCPELIFVKPRFDVYRAVSQQIRAIFADYTDLVEPLSLDEAYLDVTEDRRGLGSAGRSPRRSAPDPRRDRPHRLGRRQLLQVHRQARLDQNKPDGLCVIRPAKGPAFVATLPVKRFHGVGPKTAEKMERLGIMTGADLRALAAQAEGAGGAAMVDRVAAGNLPAGSYSYTFVSMSSGNGSCGRVVQITARPNAAPQRVARSFGDCGGGATPAPAIRARPAPRPAVPTT